VEETGATFVDGGIIGGPPAPGTTGTKLYISGPAASRVMLLAQHGLDMRLQAGPIGAASAMKMSYAGITKGFTALEAAMMLAAARAGTTEALQAELSDGTAGLADHGDAEDALQGLSLGRRDGGNFRLRRR